MMILSQLMKMTYWIKPSLRKRLETHGLFKRKTTIRKRFKELVFFLTSQKPKITLANFRPQIRKLDKDGGAKEATPVVKKPRVKRGVDNYICTL